MFDVSLLEEMKEKQDSVQHVSAYYLLLGNDKVKWNIPNMNVK